MREYLSNRSGIIHSGTQSTLNHEQSQTDTKPRNRISKHALLFIIAMTLTIFMHEPSVSFALLTGKKDAQTLADEFSGEEKDRHVSELLSMGDELVDQRNFDGALAAYEQVFTLDPSNTKASAKIDLLRKQMKKDGKNESGIVQAVYEQEAQEKIRHYWLEIQKNLKLQKLGQVRFALEKILILDPMNQEAEKLYSELKQSNAANLDEKRKAL